MSTYAQIRVAKISSFAQLTRAEIHNERLHEQEGFEEPGHLNDKRKGFNQILIENEGYSKAIRERFDDCGIKPRKNGVIALEYVIGMSSSFWKDVTKSPEHATRIMVEQMGYLAKKHGEENIIAATAHFDESNPHLHVVITPIVEKATQRFPEAKPRLCARDFVGGRKKLSELQNEFYEHCKPIAKRFGKELTKHTPVKEQRRKYEEKTNAELGQIRNQIIDIGKELETTKSKGIEAKQRILELEKEFKQAHQKLKEQEKAFDDLEPKFTKAEKDIKGINKHKIDSNRKLKKDKSKGKNQGPELG